MNQAQLYSTCNSITNDNAAYLLDNYLQLIQWKTDGNHTVLDVGCGPGEVTATVLLPALPTNVEKLIGADISEEMIKSAESQYRDSKVEFCTLDISSRNLRPDFLGQFDHLFSFYCLHWVQDQRQAFTNMYDLLKPGGDMLIAFLATNPVYEVYENMSVNSKWMEYMRDIKTYISPYHNRTDTEGDIKRLLDDTGFSTRLCSVLKMNCVFPNFSVLRNFIIAVSTFLEQIPGELHDDYITDFMDEMRKLNYIERSGSGNRETAGYPYELVVVVASKALN